MYLFSTLLADEIQADWITTFLPVLRYVLFCIIVACAIIVIIAVLLQSNSSSEGNPLTGIQETYYSKNKGSTRDGKLKLTTIICSCIIIVCVIIYFVTELVNKSWSKTKLKT